MKSLIPGPLAMFAVLLLASLSAHADDGKNSIKGGEGIGPIRIGMAIEEVKKMLGDHPDDPALGHGAIAWHSQGADGKPEETMVTLRRNPDGHHYSVDQVAVTSATFRTPAGNSTASDLAAIWREFPGLRYIYTEEGLDGSTLELYGAENTGVAILVERLPGSPKPGAPWGRCRGIVVHPAELQANFMALGVAPKKVEAD